MAFEREIRVLQIAWHCLRMGLLVSFVALGSVVLWLWANRPDMAWSDAFLARLDRSGVPVSDTAPGDWRQVCAVPVGVDPIASLRAAGAPAHPSCSVWRPWYRYYPEVGAIAGAGASGCVARPVATAGLDWPVETQCWDRRGFSVWIQTERGALTVERR